MDIKITTTKKESDEVEQGALMKTKTDIIDLIRLICDFYNAYRETLDLTHEEARYKTEFTYEDLHDWLYK